jgi:TolB-like protein/DNA-binding winged helix-turn-helix (wHTH) protein
MSQSTSFQYRFGDFCLDVAERRLLRCGMAIPLAPKVFDTLLILVENPGHLIEKEAFMKKLWPDTFVGDDALARNISILRKVMGGSSDSQSVIATVPKKGYRFIAEVAPNGLESENFQTADLWQLARGLNAQIDLPMPQTDGSEPALPTSSNGNEISEVTAPFLSPAASSSRLHRVPFLFFAIALGTCAGVATFLLLHSAPSLSRYLFWRSPAFSIHSVAVLPLQNLSGDPAQEYFSDGMTDVLITDLAQISSLRVISRTSTIRYKKSSKSLPEIAHELNVDGIVEGAVQRSGDRVRITAQLIEANSDRHVWANSYERDLKDTLSLQGEIAQSIAQQIRGNLTPREAQLLARTQPVNLKAIEPYLQGRFHYENERKMIHEGSKKDGREGESQAAIEDFKRAIAEDPNYAPAYIGMARALVERGILSPSEDQQAREILQKALAIDPSSAEAHLVLGRLDLFDWRWDDSGREYRRAMELNPNLAEAHALYSEYLDLTNHADESFHEAEIATSLDPANGRLAWEFYVRRQFDRFIEIKRNDVATHTSDPMTHYELGYGYERAGKYEQAIHEWEEALVGFGLDGQAEVLRRGYAAHGFRGGIREWVAALEKVAARGETIYPEEPAYLYAILGDKDRAFAWLEKGYQQKTHGMPFLKKDPTWDDIRSDPRFSDLERRVGLSP